MHVAVILICPCSFFSFLTDEIMQQEIRPLLAVDIIEQLHRQFALLSGEIWMSICSLGWDEKAYCFFVLFQKQCTSLLTRCWWCFWPLTLSRLRGRTWVRFLCWQLIDANAHKSHHGSTVVQYPALHFLRCSLALKTRENRLLQSRFPMMNVI